MNISKKLKLAAVVPAVMTLVIGAGLFSSYRSVGTLEEEEKAAIRISAALGELNDLARTYALRHEERPRRQFQGKHEETTKLIASAVFGDRKRRQLQERVAKDTEAVKTLFLKLVSNYERHHSIRDDALHKEAEERLVGQLMIRSREAQTDTSRLVDLLSQDVVSSQRRMYTISLAFMAVAAVPFAMVLLGLMRSIAVSLERLRKGADIIGSGDLEHRIGISSEDEIGAVAKAFDRMSEKLRAATVSRDELAVEVAQRKRTEAALENELAERRLAEESARHLASFPQLNPDPVLEVDPSGRITFFNAAARTLLRIHGMDAGGLSVLLPADLGGILREWNGQSDSSVYREVVVGRGVIGETVHLVSRFRVARIYAHDITERRRAEEAVLAAKEDLERRVAERTAELAESEERFRSLVENSPVGIFIVRGGRVVFRNPEQARLFGPMPENFEFRGFRDVHPEDASKFGELVDSISSGGEPPREIDLRFFPYGKSSEGVDMRWVHANTSPVEYGGEKAVLVSMADITRLKEMEHQFLVREKMATLGNVAAGMAHEIRNPLSGINIYLSALEKVHEDSEYQSADGQEQAAGIVRQIQDASQRIEIVIKKVMDFVRPSAVPAGPADINMAIENAIDFTAIALRKRGITLDRSYLESLPKCAADRPLIMQVIMNLITNAAEAMEKTQGPKVIGVSSAVRDGRIVIRVSDSGPGVPPALRDKIFDPFFTTRKDGYGIGLSFSRRVIADHRGLLTVGASRWGGAEFRIELPLEPEQEAGPAGTARW
jgi:PAS domain S-box-containing protein